MSMKPQIPALAIALALSYSGQAQADSTQVGIDFRYGNININNPLIDFLTGGDDLTLIGLDVYAHTEISPGLRIGGRIPIAHGRFNEDSETTLGNLSLELFYDLRSNASLETSVSFPTAEDDGDGASVASTFATFWIPDPGLYAPNTTTFRLMYNHRWSLRPGTAQKNGIALHVGAGIQFLSVDGGEDRLRVPLQLTGSIGLSGQTEAIGRFGTYWISGAEDGEDDFLHVLEAGLRIGNVGRGQLELLVYLPTDETYRDQFEAWGITVGFLSGF